MLTNYLMNEFLHDGENNYIYIYIYNVQNIQNINFNYIY